MSLEDRHVTATPEGISLELVLAGLGSRFAAFALDFAMQGAAFLIVFAIVGATSQNGGPTSTLVAEAVLSVTALVDFIGYFVLCEMLWSGRSVGKRAAGIRVVRPNGTAPGFWSILLRNLMRLVDMLPAPFYVVGSVLILVTPKNQRLGDLLADTVVIRERRAAVTVQRGAAFDDPARWAMPAGVDTGIWAGTPSGPALPAELVHWDVSAVPEADLALVRRFLANRSGYTPEARANLAMDLAARVWPSVSGPSAAPPPEQFLEAVVWVKSARG